MSIFGKAAAHVAKKVRLTSIYMPPAYNVTKENKYDKEWFRTTVKYAFQELWKLPPDKRGDKIIVQMPEALFTARWHENTNPDMPEHWEYSPMGAKCELYRWDLSS